VISITIEEALRIVVRASPILSFPLSIANTIGPAIHSPLIGEAQRIKKKSAKHFSLALRIRHASPIGVAKAPCFAFKRREHRNANNNSLSALIGETLRRS
jgi:hypothetical protein